MFVNIKYRITFVEQIERIMKTNHTQGEWTVANDETLGTVILNNGDESQLIAKVYNETKGSVELNAKLIASAPELLEALKSLLTLAIELGANPNYNIIREANEAIKKATN